MLRSPLLWLCLLVGAALASVGVLLWFAGDAGHALGVAPLVLLLAFPLVLAALQTRPGSRSGIARAPLKAS